MSGARHTLIAEEAAWSTGKDYEAGNCQKKQIGRAKRSSEREIIGKGVPDWTGSMINTLRYKNWDFTLDLQFFNKIKNKFSNYFVYLK